MIYNGSAWIQLQMKIPLMLMQKQSKATVAQTVQATPIGTVSKMQELIPVSVEVTPMFDDTNATLTVGDSGDNDRLASDVMIDLTSNRNHAMQSHITIHRWQ